MSAILAQPTPVDATMKEKNSPLSTITTLFDNMFSQRDKIESTKATGDITSSNTPEDSLSPLDTPKSEPAVPAVVMPDIQSVPEIDTFEPQQAVDVLLDAISIAPETEATTIEGCCWRLRVLCREADGPGVTVGANQCDEAKAAQAVVAAMGALPSVRPVQLQALAVLVNLGAADAKIVVGLRVVGDHVPPGTTVLSYTGGSAPFIVLSAHVTGTMTSATITLDPEQTAEEAALFSRRGRLEARLEACDGGHVDVEAEDRRAATASSAAEAVPPAAEAAERATQPVFLLAPPA